MISTTSGLVNYNIMKSSKYSILFFFYIYSPLVYELLFSNFKFKAYCGIE